MFRNKSVSTHQFAMIPRADIPRSSFVIEKAHKTTFDSGWLIPVYVDEVLPGDSFSVSMTAFARLATPLYPIMDNMTLESFFFFVPCRLLWDKWRNFMGQQDYPAQGTDYLVPVCPTPAGGWPVNSIGDYFGLPTVGQVNPGQAVNFNVLPLRAYNLIWDEWFRDENLQPSTEPHYTSEGPDDPAYYTLLRRGKRKDYFTACLPWTQKGPSVQVPLGTTAPVIGAGAYPLNRPTFDVTSGPSAQYLESGQADWPSLFVGPSVTGPTLASASLSWGAQTGLVADLSAATAATVNQIRQSFQIQKLLERDARGGTRYTELVRSHFGVISPDARQQRPEYIGGGSTPVNISPVAQTSGTPGAGGYTNTPQGNLAAIGTALAHGHSFKYSATEHGYIIGLVNVRADLNYQQGLRKMWSRRTKYDFYFPVFAALGEQAVLNKEIFCAGDANDDLVFGYQERWAEYRYNPSLITGLFRSTAAGTLDGWHLAQNFANLPTLNGTFIEERPPVDRILAVGSEANGQQFLFDSFWHIKAARPMPMYSVPGLVDHF